MAEFANYINIFIQLVFYNICMYIMLREATVDATPRAMCMMSTGQTYTIQVNNYI